MSNMYTQMQQRIGSLIVCIWPVGLAVLIISLILMVEDFRTSLAGYQMLPTAKVNETVVPFAVAFLPQAGQILMLYIGFRDTRKWWSIVIAFGFFVVDIGTDTYFKCNGDKNLFLMAFLESLLVFTIGSEFLFTVALGFLIEAFDEFILAAGLVFKGVALAFDFLFSKPEEEEQDDYQHARHIGRY